MGRWRAAEPSGRHARNAPPRRPRHRHRQPRPQPRRPQTADEDDYASVRRLEVGRHVRLTTPMLGGALGSQGVGMRSLPLSTPSSLRSSCPAAFRSLLRSSVPPSPHSRYDSRDEPRPRGPRTAAPSARPRDPAQRGTVLGTSHRRRRRRARSGTASAALHLGRSDRDRHQSDDSASVAAVGSARPPRETPVAGRPLVNLSFAINYALGGLTETGYHAVNIAIHIACALLLFGIVRRIAGRPAHPGGLRVGSRQHRPPSWRCSGWCIRCKAKSVDYITQRSESLMALFFLLTLYCAIRARPSGLDAGKPGAAASNRARQRLAGAVDRRVRVRHGVEGVDGGRAARRRAVRLGLRVRFVPRRVRGSAGTLYAGLAATWIVLAALDVEHAAIDGRLDGDRRTVDLPAQSDCR